MKTTVPLNLTIFGIILCMFSVFTHAQKLGKVDNWTVDGANGHIDVRGALTESACRLEMASAHQTIDLGTTGTGQLNTIGQKGLAIPFTIKLEDCLISQSRQRDQLANLVWEKNIPTMQIKFSAATDLQNPDLIKVNGAKGFGLALTDKKGSLISVGRVNDPQRLTLGQNQLTYYIAPMRTSANLSAGSYQAQLQFQLSYD